MITKDTFQDLLIALGFKKRGSVFSKTVTGALLVADFAKQELIYPVTQGLKVNSRQTCNFTDSENFVVFECVHRLLEKGYKPEHLELEPKWKLGHGASGGRADILIRDNAKKPLLIIECKTAGREFDKAWNGMLRDGGQLFTYAHQIPESQFLCLYASDFDDGTTTYASHIVAHRDNQDYLDERPGVRGFKDSVDAKDRFSIWRDTYRLDYTTKGIFETNIQPYHIGKDKYSLDDLNEIAETDQKGQYHRFATILRQHNVSGRENAFDKLVNLFLCKLVDEARNPHDLRFYWKGVAYDTHFDLLDRLQQLYQAGMKEFLGEEITYIDQGTVKEAMRFIKQNPDATQKAVWALFLQQKFYTNNDFSFIDVHNERLFYQNAEVLLKILRMWQDVRLAGDHQHNQFLGDLFEGFLDQGIKQSEGQYFTPMPICRFILMSLPLATLVKDQDAPPKAIDYACGAGHFLTELAQQIKPLLPAGADLTAYHAGIFGIEKEYRLSKVAKVSALMYGQRNIHICYGDALVEKHAAFPAIHDGGFDLLVANPPYSVKGFLETLPEEERVRYALTETVKDPESNNSIECFFIERAKQLLKSGGIAAIILPSSILSNGGGTYVRAREILLQYFDIVAIAEFGSGTFGKTGTNTVTLFLRRKASQPETAEHYRERVAEWFADDENQGIYQDAELIDRYAAHIGAGSTDYKTLLAGRPNEALLAHETFALYRKAFDSSSETVALKKQKGFKAKPQKEQAAEFEKRYLAFVQAIERDKLFHFVLAATQPNPVLIVKSPTDTKAQKAFLGYDWSSAKGDEGIKLVKNAHGHHVTVLYDETDRRNTAKLNRCISDNFDDTLAVVPTALADYASTARLVDLLDFSRVIFEKQFLLSPKHSNAIQSKWPMARISNLFEVIESGNRPVGGVANIHSGALSLGGEHIHSSSGAIDLSSPKYVPLAFFNSSNRGILKTGDILLCKDGALTGKVALLRKELEGRPAMVNEHVFILRANDSIRQAYLFNLLFSSLGQELLRSNVTGAAQGGLNATNLKDIHLPLPDSKTQQDIVAECKVVDKEVSAAQAGIAAAQAKTAKQIEAIYASKAPRVTIESLALNVQYGLSEKMNEAGVGYKIFRMNEIADGRMVDGGAMKCADISAEEFAKYKLNRGDVLFNRTNSIEHVGKTGLFDLEGDYCFASYLVRVVPDTKKVLPLFLAQMMNSPVFQKEAKGKAAKAINQANINATVMKNIKVPLPSPAKQEAFVAVMLEQERIIAEARNVIAAAPGRKQAIMNKYL